MRLTPVSLPWQRSPLAEPLTLADAKAYLKVDHSDEDALITRQISEARSWVETFTHRALIDQTWTLTLDKFPSVDRAMNPNADIRLPLGRTIAVTSFTYVNDAGALTPITGMEASPEGTGYQWDIGDEDGGILRPPWDSAWPDIRATVSPIRITFRAGYTSAALIPEQLLAGLKWKLADLYAMRGDQDVGGQHQVAEALLMPWRLRWL